MTTNEKQPGRRRLVVLYCVVAVLVVALAAVALVAGRKAAVNRDAEAKADRLMAGLVEVGARTPDRDQIVRLLGDDGGVVCADPVGALNRAADRTGLSNGAAGPGSRPVIADRDIVRAGLLVIGIYCPDKLSDVTDFVDSLNTDDGAE